MPVETVNTVVVQDREYGPDGQPLVNQEVTIRLAPAVVMLIAAGAAGNADQVALQPIEVRTKTDPTGFWSAKLVANTVITPSNTYYSVKVGVIKTYDIAIPTGAGPFIAQNILTGALPLFPGGSSVAGPITITGNLAVTGTGTFSGALAANAGLTVLGGGNVSGGWTIAGLLTMSDAASRLVPGSTSFSVRDNANANDNLLVSNAGVVTVRAGLVVLAGPFNVTSGGEATATDYKATGVAALASPVVSRYVGSWSTFGPPTGLTASVADFGFDGAGVGWVCTIAGTPGTWVTVSPSGRFHAEVYLGTNQSGFNPSGTLAFDTIESDPNGNFSIANHQFTCPVAGRYLHTVGVQWNSMPTTTQWAADLYKGGGVTLVRRLGGAAGGSFATSLSSVGSAVARSAAGDVMSIALGQTSGGNLQANAGATLTYWQITYLGPL